MRLNLSQIFSQRGLILALAVTCGGAVILLACANPNYTAKDASKSRDVAAVAGSLSDRGLARLTADMDPAMLSLAKRHDPVRQADPWGRTIGWTSLDITKIPDLGLGPTSVETAEEINALRAFSRLPKDVQEIASREFARAAKEQREDVAKLNAELREKLSTAGLQFNDTDPAAFRDALRKAGFYAEWKGKFGDAAWKTLEDAVGGLA